MSWQGVSNEFLRHMFLLGNKIKKYQHCFVANVENDHRNDFMINFHKSYVVSWNSNLKTMDLQPGPSCSKHH